MQAVAATPATYMPDAQFAQASWPGVGVYMPARQSIHIAASAVVCPVRPYLPATQDVPVHVLALAAPVAAAEPGTGDWVMSMPLKEPGLQLETAPSIM